MILKDPRVRWPSVQLVLALGALAARKKEHSTSIRPVYAQSTGDARPTSRWRVWRALLSVSTALNRRASGGGKPRPSAQEVPGRVLKVRERRSHPSTRTQTAILRDEYALLCPEQELDVSEGNPEGRRCPPAQCRRPRVAVRARACVHRSACRARPLVRTVRARGRAGDLADSRETRFRSPPQLRPIRWKRPRVLVPDRDPMQYRDAEGSRPRSGPTDGRMRPQTQAAPGLSERLRASATGEMTRDRAALGLSRGAAP
jgi:hypothetical protein